VVLTPEADRESPSAWKKSACTPVNAEKISPPSSTDCDRNACTTSSPPVSWFGEGKFCTFVATYVAIETPPALMNRTRW